MRADSISHDRHAFNDCMRVTFQNGTVHECTRVAFIGVADDILFIARLILFELPLDTGRETGTAAAAQTGSLDNINDFLRFHGGQNLT